MAAAEAGARVTVQRVGTMLTVFFSERPVENWAAARAADTEKFAIYFRKMLEAGIYLAPSQFEAGSVSAARDEVEIAQTLVAATLALRAAAAL